MAVRADLCRAPHECVARIRHWQRVADEGHPRAAQHAEDEAMRWKRRLNELGGPPPGERR